MKKILLIEDDVNLGTTLNGALESQQYEVHYLTGSSRVEEEMRLFQPDIVLLDVMLNEQLDGFDIARQIRKTSQVPILFTTSRDGNVDFATGFSLGNTDYVRKPYKLMEVLLRIERILAAQTNKEAFRIGHFGFFPCEQSLRYDCGNIHLNSMETAVLTLLCKNEAVFVSKKTIIEMVWNETDPKLKEGSLNNVLSNLRKYLQKDSRILLESKVGLGVRLINKH